MQRLMINHGRYHGECIDIHQVLRQIETAAVKHAWQPAPIQVSASRQLPAFHRQPASANTGGLCPKEVYISSGIHGDEPAGPLSVLRLLKENQWPEELSIWLVPCLNPGGFILNCREDDAGIDLNRDYRTPKTDVVRAHIAWLEERPEFDLTLLLHEDWEANGFYLYELNPDQRPSFAEAIIEHVKTVCPVDTSPLIEGRPASNGIIHPHINMDERPDWPEAFYLSKQKTRMNYTLEAPSDFPLPVRVDALVAAVQGALKNFGING